MSANYQIKDWEELINNSSLSKKEKKEKLFFIRSAYHNGVPVILDLDHLAHLLGLKVGVLSAMIKKPLRFYRQFKIPKKRGGFRDIVTPYESLLEVQQWIVEHVLSKFQVHDAAHAYVKKRNIAQNASIHVGCDEMLKIDLKDFFPSIKIPRVRELFNRVGYSKEVSYYLTNLCCLNGSIPQGAASSPMISNIILFNLDKRLSVFSKNHGVKYSRYADDLVFSGNFQSFGFKNLVIMNIEDEGFKANTDKTREYCEGHRKMITGIVVEKDRIRLPKAKRREIRTEVYFLMKYGIFDQVKRYNDIYYADRVLGRLNYWKQIEPNNEYVIDSIKSIKKLYEETLKQIST
ncbi:RNA-directed DNA polymerase [Mangrovimonas sp. CR14]|uniref:retron St85 family RNA-directed DNA polymerase n=1 Tax=Mangrovimonas sp. CR14 TaxID=2706120 RepID=UPI00141DB711|nr:retron St85 family RNA-directed DNA polymerase [Mangrovimonas sp. CR14]NIK93095.1 RNA-directed DNA polymerase [Mangrovimonas sp. CR14]